MSSLATTTAAITTIGPTMPMDVLNPSESRPRK